MCDLSVAVKYIYRTNVWILACKSQTCDHERFTSFQHRKWQLMGMR